MTNFYSQIAGIISFGSYAIYIISTLQGKTRPSRSTWWVLTLIGVLIFSSSYSVGARENVWIQLCYVIGPLVIAILSIKYGYGEKKLIFIDKTCIVTAGVCMVTWLIFDSPFIAFLVSIVADLIALLPTIKKSYQDTESEDVHSWIVETFASFTNAFGILICFDISDMSWVYALYLLAVNGTITTLLLRNSKIKYKIPGFLAGKQWN